jgi:hypothetical protein
MSTKSSTLRASTQKKIGQFYADNPDATYPEIAHRFNITVRQAEYAVNKFLNGELEGKSNTRGSDKQTLQRAQALRTKKGFDKQALFQEQLEIAIVQLSLSDKLDVLARIKALESIAYLERVVQQTELVGMLKNKDGNVIREIIRLFEPDATDKRVIEIYKQAEAVWLSKK